jgi:alkylresorcinol/alkylpyrone synthase
MTRIMAVRSAFPKRYAQAELTSKFADECGLGPVKRAVVERLHGNAGVDYRHIVLPLPEYGGLRETGVANDDHRRGPAAGIGRPHDRAGPRGQH